MILFVSDQVAGAEYLLPSLKKWAKGIGPSWHFIASPVSSRFLTRHGLEHTIAETSSEAWIREQVETLRPQLGVFSASVGSEMEVGFVREFKRRGVKCVQVVDQWAHYRKRFEHQGIAEYPDYVLAPDDESRADMIREGIPEALIRVIGQPYLEMRLKAAAAPRAPSAQRVLLVSQPVAKYWGDSLGYTEETFLTEALEEWKRLGRPWSEIVISRHPEEPEDKFRALSARYSSELRVESMPDPDFRAFSAVLGMFSSVLTQSLLAGAPTASFQPQARGDDRCFLSQRGYIPKFKNAVELETFLRKPRMMPGCEKLKAAIVGSQERFEAFVKEALT